MSIFDGNDGHWINLSDIQSGRKLAEIVTLLTLTLNWHPANIHLHFMKNWTKMKKENSFKYWNKNCLLLLSYKRYPRLEFLFWLYPNWKDSICDMYCPCLNSGIDLFRESYDTTGGKLRWCGQKLGAGEKRSKIAIFPGFNFMTSFSSFQNICISMHSTVDILTDL